MPHQSLPPLLIITTAVALMGGLQSAIHQAFHGGEKKRVRMDDFDYCLTLRDKRLLEESPPPQQQ
eukprot:CAMPEP_0114560920 /NCGR_PEP_ID=MMETSP0114-20121206/11725_1 /TAXON_ID=31324 /ORGANISM="Goniomonas sp, Strain m" /LENGTH=64 /DNA_ID=CAMNT_0001746515 /DNA_START=33 /DNA_END=227 /DNA_ORIENTATION=-